VSTEERILLIRLSHLGDVVHALPVFHALRAARPTARIAWAVQREFAGLLEGLQGLERTIPFDRRGGARAWLELRAELSSFGPTLAVDAQGNLKSAMALLASGAPRRAGLAWAEWREPLGACVLTEQAPPVANGSAPTHALERMRGLARYVAGLPQDAPLRMDPDITSSELAKGREQLGRVAPSGRGPLAIVQLARAGDIRSWPLERFGDLAQSASVAGWRVLLLSGPEEELEGQELARALGASTRIGHWIGQSGLRELAAALTAAASEGAVFVGCDSGPMHLAVACGLPVVAMSGPQDPLRTGPWPSPIDAGQSRRPSSPHRVVRARHPPACAPCLARECSHPEGPVCMSGIEPAEVLAALEAQL
jgi:ADP-heptose:LPS heptosyltransferase